MEVIELSTRNPYGRLGILSNNTSSSFRNLIGWLVVLRIHVTLAVFQPYRDLEAGDRQSLKFKWRGGESKPGPLALLPPLPFRNLKRHINITSIVY